MEKYDFIFECEFGQFTVNGARRFPTEQEINEKMEDFEGIGLGKLKKFVAIFIET